ncbi:unnamed protein product [Adineta steineri]|uniref:PARP n=2 Tax=Adineta steineri TaxID=433720 RepID=A0A814FSQ3_9BILA|nr:unnamed protein product [Adineta steineri]
MKQVIQIETSDSSDDEKNTDGGKATKLKIADVAENDEHSSADEKEKNVTNKVSSKTKRKTKRTSNTKRKQNRPKSTSTSERSRRKTVQTGLNGNYWNVVQIDRNSTTSTYNSNQLNDDDDDDDDGNDSIYSSGREDDTKLQKILASSSSSSSEREVNLRTLLYSNRTFITCRSPEDSFFLCQVLQDVYNDTKRIRIRWCSLADENGDETKVDDKTHFKFDYEDTLDPKTVLTGIPHVTRHADNTISLKEPDIIETKRLLEKSIRGESLSSDEPMDLSTENNIKTSNKSTSDLSNDSLPIKEALKKIKKRKISPESSRKQPVKKKIRKMSGESTLKRRPTIDINDIEDDEKQILKTKKSPKKTVAKPTTTPKAQLFKVQSNRLLKENLTITTYRKEPFFEDDLSVPYVSSIVQSKLAIRAVLINDPILLKGLIDDVNRVCSVHVQRGLHNELTAIHYAIKNDNIELLKILLEDLKTPKLDRCPFPTVTMTTRSTGRANIHAFGFRTAQLMASRGAKEGNNALNKDNMNALTIYHGQEIILYAIKNNCTRQIYDLLLEAYAHNNNVYENISHIVRGGYRKLAASIIGDIKDNTFYGFNNLHHQVLLFDGEDLTINRATIAKPTTTPKAQLFKVQSNRLLKENLTITTYRKEPFFEDDLSVPYVSSIVQSKLAIRAVLINDPILLKGLIDDVNRVCSVHVQRGLHNELTAIHYAIKTDNIELLKMLLEDLKTPKLDRCPFPTVTMTTRSTGRANIHAFGFRTAQIMASRGAKEGNNALNKDNMSALTIYHGQEIILYAIKNNCTRQIYDLLLEAYAHNNNVYENISHIVRGGYRKLAASIIGDIKDNTFYGFNNLHHQVLLFDGEDLTINRATSVVKKTKDNFQITPIHCAAINPNSKYLKQLLNVMPEYNILDKYERRPIHFAAACEGPEPLEFLLSKQVNFNDVDRGGNSPLHIAAMYGRAINAEILLRTAKEKAESNDAEDQIVHQKFGLASINRLNKTRFYPLHLAVVNNHLECVKVLLEFGANVDAPTSTSSGKLTPLMLACQKGYLKIVVHLIENGARVEARDRFKRTPLIHACMCGNAHIVSHLLRMGANANVCDSSLNTALHYSIAYGWYFCVRLLIEAGANVNCVNSWQTTCLAAGFLKGHYGICDYLLTDHHVDINFKTDDGLTLVMLTVGLDVSSSSVQQLDYVVTKHKADCTCVDSNGNNAFHYLASNISGQNIHYEKSEDEKAHHDNFFQIAQALFDHECEPNKLNNKAQSALMIALEAGNFLLVDYLINKAQVEINPDVSHDGKNLLHYFAIKCDEYDLIQTLIKLPINDEIKKMSQMFDNSGRTPFHYCTSKFNEFCLANKSADGTDLLKKQYQSIIQMIEYCLESVQCDPDLEIRSNNDLKKSTIEQIIDDEEQSNENSQPMDDTSDEAKISKPKETSIFSLLRTVSFASQHPLELFLTKTKNINVLHHETQRTPLLEAIYLQEYQTAHMLMKESSCDINLSTSIIDNERQQTPLILACKLQSLSIIRDLLNHKQCHILAHDNQQNQAIHYYLATSNRSNQYLDLLNLFIEKLKQIDSLNMSGKDERTPLHIAVYHNSGAIDSTTDVEEILIDNKCDLLIRDKLGNIPLHNIFLNKNIGDDPVELCVLILKAMKYESLDTKNNEGNTPLHLAVLKCSTVCITLLQQHKASLIIENNLSNSIIGTCIASGHLNLFITFLQQSIDIDLGKMHNILIKEISSEPAQQNNSPFMTASFFPTMTPSRFPMRAKRVQLSPRLKSTQNQITTTENKLLKQDNNKETWIWKYADIKKPKQFKQYSLIYLIIERDWQGALSLILNDLERFHLSYIQVLEAAILKNKLNLVLRLLSRLKDKTILHGKNSHRQNLFHLLANMDSYDNDLFKQILLHIHEYHVDWNLSDKYGSYPIHYACVKQNFLFLSFLREKYPTEFSLNQLDTYENPAISLLFRTTKTEIKKNEIQLLVIYGKQLDCLCNYQNEIAMNPLSFGYNDSSDTNESYPPMKSDSNSTNIRTSPLINAIVHNNFQLVKFLLQLDTDVNFPDAEKRTPLMHAVRQNNIDIVKLLLNKDYSLEEKSDPFQGFQAHHFGQRLGRGKGAQNFFLGATAAAAPISTSSATSTDESKKFLVTSTIDLNASDPLGRTCIHHLVQPFPDGSYTSNIELLRLLHSSGASITQLDLAGLSPLQYGAINGCQHLCDELIKLINDETGMIINRIKRYIII